MMVILCNGSALKSWPEIMDISIFQVSRYPAHPRNNGCTMPYVYYQASGIFSIYHAIYKSWIICWNWFSLLCSLSAFCDWILKHFTSLYIGIVIYSIIEICWNHFILKNSIALPSAVYYFVTSDKSSAFLFWKIASRCVMHISYILLRGQKVIFHSLAKLDILIALLHVWYWNTRLMLLFSFP
jgi:hypothetical protein